MDKRNPIPTNNTTPLPKETAPNPKAKPEPEPAGSATQAAPQPYNGMVVDYVSRERYIQAAATNHQADPLPAIVARVLPNKGPDDVAGRVDLVVIDPERESGTYVERTVVPFDGTGPGYQPRATPQAVTVPLGPLQAFVRESVQAYLEEHKPATTSEPVDVSVAVEDYLAQRKPDDDHVEAIVRRVLASHKVPASASDDAPAKGKGK